MQQICSKFTREHPCFATLLKSRLPWMFSSKFAACFQSILLYEHLWRVDSEKTLRQEIFEEDISAIRNFPLKLLQRKVTSFCWNFVIFLPRKLFRRIFTSTKFTQIKYLFKKRYYSLHDGNSLHNCCFNWSSSRDSLTKPKSKLTAYYTVKTLDFIEMSNSEFSVISKFINNKLKQFWLWMF